MQQSEVSQNYFYCPTCQLAINNTRKEIHLRKCNGEKIQEPLAKPIKKPPTQEKIKCNICEKTMSLHQFKYHEYFCTEAMAPCQFCNKQIFLFRLEDHQNYCKDSDKTSQERRAILLKKYFLLAHGVELEGQLSTDTIEFLYNEVFPALEKMKKTQNSRENQMLQLNEHKHDYGEKLENCTICLDGIYSGRGEEFRIFKCKHLFHKKCVDVQLRYNNLCPNCRCELTQAQ